MLKQRLGRVGDGDDPGRPVGELENLASRTASLAESC